MKSIATAGLMLTLILAAACSESDPTTAPLVLEGPAFGIARSGGTTGTAHLAGANEVPSRDTRARGQAVFKLSDEGLSYRLIVANIENVVASHLHLGPADANGPVVAFLAGPFPAGGGAVNGVLAEGTVTAADLIGPLAGQTLEDLVALIAAGNVYVNVHTNDGIGGVNTGPGDFASGEIRGQVQWRGAP